MSKDISYVDYSLYGGAEVCERQMLKFGSEEMFGYDEEFPISCVIVEPLLKKFADDLGHRDYLGALMNLGIERNTIGDIFVKDKTAYIFCVDRIAPYITDNLDKVRHTNVKCSIEKGIIEAVVPEKRPVSVIVSSERIDGVIARLYNMSRSRSVQHFREKKVMVNGRVMENNSYVMKPEDVISVRGYGKFIFCGVENETRKGRLKVQVLQYV